MPRRPLHPTCRTRLEKAWVPGFAALVSILAALVQPLRAASGTFAPSSLAPSALASVPHSAPVAAPLTVGLTESQLQGALPGRTLVRVSSGEFQRVVSTQGSRGRLITGPALSALLASNPSPSAAPEVYAQAAPRDPATGAACAQRDSLARLRCQDSLFRAQSAPKGPRALREIDAANRHDTVYIGPDGRPISKASVVSSADPAEGEAADLEAAKKADAEAQAADEVRQERNRSYFGQFFFDMSRSTGDDWNWDGGDWAVVLYVVIGVIVVGAFVIAGGKAIYDLVVNKERAPIFKEVGARFSYSGLTMYDSRGAPLYRDAYLAGLRFAFGVEKNIMSLGLALEAGSVNLTVSGLSGPTDAVDYRGGYLVGGPMVRFGNYHPLALTLEFLNGTSDHRSIGWISKSRMMLAAKSPAGFLVGAHLGAVFYDLKVADGLVFRRGDLNRDLSVMVGLDAGWAF